MPSRSASSMIGFFFFLEKRNDDEWRSSVLEFELDELEVYSNSA